MPKGKWGCAEEPTIKLIANNFEYALKCRNRHKSTLYHISSEVDSDTTWQQVSSGTQGLPAATHVNGKLEQDIQISKQHFMGGYKNQNNGQMVFSGSMP